MKNRILSMIIAIMMVLGMLPLGILAQEEGEIEIQIPADAVEITENLEGLSAEDLAMLGSYDAEIGWTPNLPESEELAQYIYFTTILKAGSTWKRKYLHSRKLPLPYLKTQTF